MTDLQPYLANLASWPLNDFSQFGEIEVKTLPKLQRLSAAFLGRNWIAIPHVTHHDEADITTFERRRQEWNSKNPDRKLTAVSVLGKLLADALATFPQFNASITADTTQIVLKKYVNVGFAIDSPRGLLVGVVRNCDTKSPSEIAFELAALAAKARDKGLSMPDMSGGCITISSLGHIGGTAFTPIVNAPEVAILGVTRSQVRAAPAADSSVEWRTMLPLSLSYDHRIINGADAARFVRFIADRLNASDIFA